jgi:DNA recombination protein RmuC
MLQRTKDEAAAVLQRTREEDAAALQASKDEAAAALQRTREEAARLLEETKADLRKRSEEDIAAREKAHKDAMTALQIRFDETMAKISAQVKSDTSDMLKARQQEFSQASNLSLGQIVTPLKENIAELRKAMEQGREEQAERSGQMREHIKNLMEQSEAARKSADELAAAFKHGSKMQGDWGETILEELLSTQGLTKGVHFDTQAVIRDSEGHPVKNEDGSIMRPDVILHLDERREVIIDSKVSLSAYVDYVNAENETDRRAFLKAHVESVRQHVKELSQKDYSAYVKSPKVSAGYVIMFVPNVGALWTALNAEPDLWRKAADMNVYIADEQSLYGALKIVSMTWTQVSQAHNHEKVYELANEMIDRVGLFMEKYEAVGKALKKASDEYEDGRRKLTPRGQSIINTSSKLIKLGARNSDKHPIKALLDVDDIPSLPGPDPQPDSDDDPGPRP